MSKLSLLEDNILQLERLKIKHKDNPDFFSEKTNEWALRYGFLESIQIIIDISCDISTTYNLGNPKNSRECIEILATNKYLSSSLSETLAKMVGLRNLLAHEYAKINIKQLASFLNRITDFKKFISEVSEYY
ncbi:MAG: DUF86 domain-containing protein [Leptospiraceae bacterium]|nr:DUF86 domain-containing protein [Leptospiraceae bacterium]